MVSWLFIIMVVIQCAYALYFFLRILGIVQVRSIPAAERRPVTVIICAKDEAENLKKNLPAVLSQNYKDKDGKALYEVIVVNDASTDDTAAVLQELEQRYDNLWDVIVTHNEARNLRGKKYALSKGLSYATHDWLVLIDADCMPSGDGWLAQMVAPLAQGKEIVAGYGGYNKSAGLLNAFIRWETLHTFLQYSTYARAGVPYMAVGRNMACTADILLRAQQDAAWNKLPSGDDDLLVSICGTAHNTAVVCNDKAFTHSDAKATWHEWITQKQRHLSTGKYYKTHIKLLLGVYGASHALVWMFFFILLFTGYWKTALFVMGLRCLVYWGLWAVTAVKLHERNLIYLFPVFDIGWLVYNFAFLPYITLINKKHWK